MMNMPNDLLNSYPSGSFVTKPSQKPWSSDQKTRSDEIIAGTNDATWEWMVQTGETHFNERWAEMVGYTLAELEPISIQTWLNLCHPADVEKSNELLQKTFSGELKFYECELRMLHKNNYWVWVLDRGKVVEWADDGKPLRMAGTHYDVTKNRSIQNELETNQARLNAIFNNVEEGIFTSDENGTIETVNHGASAILGYENDELVGMNLKDLLPVPTVHQHVQNMPAFLKSGQLDSISKNRELAARKKDGTTLPVEFRSSLIALKKGNLYVSIMRELKELKAQRSFAETILSKNAAVIVTLDIDYKVQTASDAWTEQFGYTPDETIGKDFSSFLSPHTAAKFNSCECEPDKCSNEHERTVQTLDLITSEGKICTVELHSAINNASDQMYQIITIIDVTEKIRQREELTDLVERDELTRLYSRRGFYKHMADGVRTCDVGLLLIDVDRFKSINDAFGHLIGDSYLKQIATKLNLIVGKDGLAARFGGEEFLLAFPAKNLQEVRDVADKARRSVENFILKSSHGPIMRTVSLGGALLPMDGKVSKVLGMADMALGHAKASGRNKAIIADPEFIDWLRASGKLTSLEDVRKALENNEFELWLQPFVNLENNSIIGHEALMRWCRPDGQVLLPHVFLDKLQSVLREPYYVKYRSKIIKNLLDQVAFSPSSLVSLNVRMEDLAVEKAAENIMAWLDCNDEQKKSIVLEISEDAWSSRSDIETVIQQIEILREQGFRIALDDFGKASSNLLRLTKLPIDIVKLDKSLITDVVKDEKCRLAVRGIASIATDMGMIVMAEGVETEEQANYLCEQGIVLHQGFLYSKAKQCRDVIVSTITGGENIPSARLPLEKKPENIPVKLLN